MIYFFAVILPPLGLLMAGKPVQAILNLVLLLLVVSWPICAVWAVAVVANTHAEQRARRLEQAIRASGAANLSTPQVRR